MAAFLLFLGTLVSHADLYILSDAWLTLSVSCFVWFLLHSYGCLPVSLCLLYVFLVVLCLPWLIGGCMSIFFVCALDPGASAGCWLSAALGLRLYVLSLCYLLCFSLLAATCDSGSSAGCVSCSSCSPGLRLWPSLWLPAFPGLQFRLLLVLRLPFSPLHFL